MSTIGTGTLTVALTMVKEAGEQGISASELAFQMEIPVSMAIKCLKELHRLTLAEYVPHSGLEIRMRANPAAQKQE